MALKFVHTNHFALLAEELSPSPRRGKSSPLPSPSPSPSPSPAPAQRPRRTAEQAPAPPLPSSSPAWTPTRARTSPSPPRPLPARAPAPAPGRPRSRYAKTCVVCSEEKDRREFPSGTPCAFGGEMGPAGEEGHALFCKECLGQMVGIKVREAFGPLTIKCPHPGCSGRMQPYTVRGLLRYTLQDEELVRKFSQLQVQNHGHRLKELFAAAPRSQEDRLTVDWLKTNTRYCPMCNVLIEKNMGCNDLLCSCGFHFCFGCGNAHRYCRCDDDASPSPPVQSKMANVRACYHCSSPDHLARECPRRAEELKELQEAREQRERRREERERMHQEWLAREARRQQRGDGGRVSSRGEHEQRQAASPPDAEEEQEQEQEEGEEGEEQEQEGATGMAPRRRRQRQRGKITLLLDDFLKSQRF